MCLMWKGALIDGSVDYEECGVWKVRSVESAECGKCGVWKMWSVENEECGKCGVWKMRRKFQFSILISIPMRKNSVEEQLEC